MSKRFSLRKMDNRLAYDKGRRIQRGDFLERVGGVRLQVVGFKPDKVTVVGLGGNQSSIDIDERCWVGVEPK